jgi:uncharacterized membrane protein YoaK (UPF0700 family)
MSDRDWPEHAYATALLILTAATGAIDGVSYLALDRVFTGNMTGNVLFIGFGLVGVAGIPVLNNLVALLAFLLGAVVGARVAGRSAGTLRLRRSGLVLIMANAGLVLILGGAWLVLGKIGTPVMIAITGVLALLLGSQAAALKQIGLRDLSTVVVTMTMVNLGTDSRLAGGPGVAWRRRLAAIVTMGLGALGAAAVTRSLGGAYALLLAGVVMASGAVALGRARRLDAAGLSQRSGGTVTSAANV